ncbi:MULTISPECIES: ABC transporter substrate-binding protein [Paenibacillus]|uniref:ABC transporter substrate-binding protein n=1 Tax=Paenibacillus TaxID=44249 RepID=UPI0022B85BB5|nr:extracellular solute-binding protein [Paenibacillus caseinilyticus]MCZ8518828.1 extracellular solute-binding protein [Paenibacillus caseinilyticus]
MNSTMKRGALLSLSVLMTLPLAACMNQGGKDNETKRTLRIGTMNFSPNDDYFRQRFTELYEFANKNIEVEMVPLMDESQMYGNQPKEGEKQKSPMEVMKEKLTGDNPPDVVMVNYEQIPELVENNLLTQLDPLITKDKFDTSDMVPAVIEGIKKVGDGKIFALSPLFSSSALAYNKKMFEEAGVPYPTDKMTWEQVFELARRVAKGEGKDRKYGFAFSTYGGDAYYASQIYSAPLQLKMIDDAGEKMTVDTDQWEKVWKTIQGLQTEKLVADPAEQEKMRQQMMQGGSPEDYSPFQGDDFLSNKVAMAVINYHQIDNILNAMKNAQNYKGFTPFDWDVVTLPVHPEAPDVGGSIWMEGLMGVNSKAQNPDDAWDFIKFVNGEDWARLKAGSQSTLVSRQKYIKQKEGAQYNIKAFTTLLPVTSTENSRIYMEKPYLGQVTGLGQMKFQEVLNGKLQVREALKQWQTEGDAMLQKLKENPNAQLDMGMGK